MTSSSMLGQATGPGTRQRADVVVILRSWPKVFFPLRKWWVSWRVCMSDRVRHHDWHHNS
jgi:hypothetical protein